MFPIPVDCFTATGGISGEVDLKSNLCLLKDNFFNQYFFVFLWWWWQVINITECAEQ